MALGAGIVQMALDQFAADPPPEFRRMGEVYIAAHTRMSKRFAVKLLAARHGASAEAYARFQREAEITSRLGHPHIVEIIDFWQLPDGVPYLVMEYLEGESLGARLQRLGVRERVK